MFRFKFLLAVALSAVFVTAAYPDSSLQDWEFNINGTTYYPAAGDTLGSVPGLNSGAFNATTGLGTLTVTFNPGAPGSYYVGAWFFVPVGVPFYNEYGIVSGAPASGQTYQIDIPEYDAVSANNGAGTIIDNLALGTLDNTNHITGSLDNYLFACGANGGGAANTSCNDLVSMATGFNFSLATGQQEVITLNLATTNPGGFSLEDFHPADGGNPNAGAVYYSANAVTVPVGTPPTTPEPGSGYLVAVAFLAGLALVTCKRFL